jgi:hypothetical protein
MEDLLHNSCRDLDDRKYQHHQQQQQTYPHLQSQQHQEQRYHHYQRIIPIRTATTATQTMPDSADDDCWSMDTGVSCHDESLSSSSSNSTSAAAGTAAGQQKKKKKRQHRVMSSSSQSDSTAVRRGNVVMFPSTTTTTNSDSKRRIVVKTKSDSNLTQCQSDRRRQYNGRLPSHLSRRLHNYFDSIVDVPSDGHCGYHVLMDGLRENNLLPQHITSVTDLRKSIVDYALQNKSKLLESTSTNYFHTRGVWNFKNDDSAKTRQKKQFHDDLNNIYDPIKAWQGIYEKPVDSEDWIKTYVVMPLVSQMFGVHIWILSVDGDYYCGGSSCGRSVLDDDDDDDVENTNSSSRVHLHHPEYTTTFQYQPQTDSVEFQRHDNQLWFPSSSQSSQSSSPSSPSKEGNDWHRHPTIYALHVNQNHYVRGVCCLTCEENKEHS